MNPLPIDWAQGIELNARTLLARESKAIEQQRLQTVIILQKVKADTLSSGFSPISPNDTFYTVARYVKATSKRLVTLVTSNFTNDH